MHKDWCGKPCSACKNPCALDEQIPCSPDCSNLGENGETNSVDCKGCDAIIRDDEEDRSFHNWDATDDSCKSMTCAKCGLHVVFDGSPTPDAVSEPCTPTVSA